MEKLTLEKIKSYGFKERTHKPDWDDVQVDFTLPNGIELSALTVCCNQPVNVPSLEGLDGYIYIQYVEELDNILKLSYEEVLNKIASDNDDFDINKYI